ncbi:MAG: DoxX family protein [Actinomycetaceae bacterium]|nr:DoxX family protein [Actinomycetaceae bacterium]
MSILRTLSRVLIAGAFVYDGVDAVLHTKKHVERFQKVEPVLEKAGVPPIMEADAKMATRALGAATAVCGASLALGVFPRTCAAILAVVNLPIAAVNYPLHDRATRKDNLKLFGLRATLSGGLIMAAFDRKGSPSLEWRYQNWKALRKAEVDTIGEVIA